MIYKGKFKIINNLITACDYSYIDHEVNKAIKNKKILLISPIASHTLVRANFSVNLKETLDAFDYLVPDSQWVRWSIAFIYGKDKSLHDRVYGPKLMLNLCNLAAKKRHKIFLYGNTKSVLEKLKNKLEKNHHKIIIADVEESKFRELSNSEWNNLTIRIKNSGAKIIFVSLGSPKQEIFSQKLSQIIIKPLTIIPVGAAFDFISGNKRQAPKFMSNVGFEWFFRLLNEPIRLFPRYFINNTLFIMLILKQKLKNYFI